MMNDERMTTSGHLNNGSRSVPVDVMYASPHSLYVRPAEETAVEDRACFNGLILKVKDTTQAFGACSFLSDESAPGYAGRLVFTRDVYDFKSLFYKNRYVDSQDYFSNLPLILAQKERISPSFRQYTADVAYDFRVYRQFFDEIDRKLASEPLPVREASTVAILETRGREFMEFFDQTLSALEDEVTGFSREEHERHGYYFRKQVADLIHASEFMSLTNTKPRGYLGDPDMMAILYENDYRGRSTFAKLMHKHPIETTAAQAVRNRRAYIKQLILDAERSSPSPKPEGFRLLSVASGSAYEAGDLFAETEGAFDRFSCTLLDQDETALGDAMRAIAGVKQQVHHGKGRFDATALNKSVRTMLRTPNLSAEWGQFHFIYSVGLFDYLTPPVARQLARKLYDLVLPGGVLVLGNYHTKSPTRCYMDYWMDWPLYYRTEPELAALLDEDVPVNAEVRFEASGSQMFLHAKKQP